MTLNRPPLPSRRVLTATIVAAALLLVFVRCASAPSRRGDEIVAAGQHFTIGTPVVLWTDEGGYDAYQKKPHFTPLAKPDGRRRYGEIRTGLPAAIERRVQQEGWRLEDLQQHVHLFVLHFDMAGTSRQCFKVLHDVRYLSVHFLLDVDGTIYQTLDLQEHAHHATIANAISIGVEIAHPGAWLRPRHPDMLRWYARDEQGWFLKYPAWLGETGIRTPMFVPRPDRPEPISGLVHGREYWQLDYTPQQYHALAHLCAALSRVFPRIRLEVPRNEDGSVRTTQLSEEELRAFEGIIGHFHVQPNKYDPGPAMQWDRLLEDARALR